MSDALIRAGRKMANALYNLANDKHLVGLDEYTKKSLALLCQEWDDELKTSKATAQEGK